MFDYPGKETYINIWKRYIQSYKIDYMADIIFAEGRFRVEWDIFSKIKNDIIILIHDYTNRIKYHIIEKYYKKVKAWDTLAVFIKAEDLKIFHTIFNINYLYKFL